MQQYDILIIGAGPAGCAAAIQLGKTDLHVAVIDKAAFPRDKTCGDALSVDVMNQLPMLSEALAEKFKAMAEKVPSWGVTIYSPNANAVEIPFIHNKEEKCGYICKRWDFDHLLFGELEPLSNIDVYEGEAVETITREDGEVHVTTSTQQFKAKMILGADGANSVVSRLLDGPKTIKNHHSAGLRVYYDNVQGFHEKDYIELFFFEQILPGYLWIFPLPDHKANVGIGMLSSEVSKRNVNLREVLNELITTHPRLKDRFANARALETIKGFGLPLGSIKREISGDQFLLLGDAAGLIDPFSGEGIANAIRSGRVAADHLAEAFAASDFSAAFNKAYDKEIYRRMWNEFQVSRTLQKLARAPRLFNFMIKKAHQSKRMKRFIIESLANVEKKKLLTKTISAYRLFVKDGSKSNNKSKPAKTRK